MPHPSPSEGRAPAGDLNKGVTASSYVKRAAGWDGVRGSLAALGRDKFIHAGW